MVKRMFVVFSALALMITMVGVASAQFAPPGFAATGDTIMIPMKVKTTFSRTTGAGGFSTFFMNDCEQYTNGFHPWGPWRETRVAMKTQVIPPTCVMPAVTSLTAMAAPVPVAPGSCLISNTEKWSIKSPGCNPCVAGDYKYEMVRKQGVKK